MPYAPRLERVILENATIRDYGDTDLGMVMHYIGRSWTCTGSLRDDEPNQCIAEECDDKEIEERRLDDEEGLLTEATKGLLRPILLEVWPECDGQDFRDVWHSFPLAEHQIPQPANEGYGRQDPEWRRSGLMDDLPVSMCY
nr:hypothetical protein B0A51_07958 [Rachicladosporium sp. CCFEE 5018]